MKKKGLGSPADKLGVHIRKYRNQKKWSQKDLANKIGTDQTEMLQFCLRRREKSYIKNIRTV